MSKSLLQNYLQQISTRPTLALVEEIQAEPESSLSEDEKLFLKSRYYLQQNDLNQAVTILSILSTRHPEDIATLIELGNTLYQSKKFDEAIAVYSQLLALDSEQSQANQNLGNIHLMQNNYVKALEFYVKVIIAHPDHLNVTNNAIFCQYKLENYPAAKTLLAKITESKKTAYSFRLAALIAFEEKDLDKSSSLFMQSIHLDDKNVQTWSELALTEKDRGMHENAYKCISMANGLAPTNVDYYLFKSAYGLVIDGADHRQHLLSLIDVDILNETKMTALSLYIQYCLKFAEVKTADDILNYKHFVRTHTLDFSAAEKLSLCNFIMAREDLAFELKGTTTKNGRQTLSLAQEPQVEVQKLIAVIKEKACEYATNIVKTSSIYAKLLQNKVRLKIWSVVLDEGGYQAPHMHPGGIISGCFYLKFNRESNPGYAGNIEFGNPEKQFKLPVENLTKMVQVEEDKLVIFPSYYFHNTFPTKSTSERISIAFDIVPVEEGVIAEDNLTAAFNLLQ